jgi:hypothetical protein
MFCYFHAELGVHRVKPALCIFDGSTEHPVALKSGSAHNHDGQQ